MQLQPSELRSLLFVLLNTLGIFALALILAYAVYGTDTDDE